jgi:hypothetical protein
VKIPVGNRNRGQDRKAARLSRALWVVVIPAALACGGKTANEESGGAGGGVPFDAGFAGNGGSAGSATNDGASGTAASGSGGGTGSGGVAGSGAGAVGTGGDSGAIGTGGSGGTGDIGELVDAACATLIGTPCGINACPQGPTTECTLEGCRALIWQNVTLAQRIGCMGEFAANLVCLRANPNSCMSNQCDLVGSRFIKCLEASPRGRCMFVENAGECSMWCPGWGGRCTQSPNALECACSSGPNPDRTFIVPGGQCAGDAWITPVEQACR